MKKNLIAGYSIFGLSVVAAIIVGVLAGLGYFKKNSSSSTPILPFGTNTDLTEIQLSQIKSMWDPYGTLTGVQYLAKTVCQVQACQVEIVATYLFPNGTTDTTTKTFGNTGYYHNTVNNHTQTPLSVKLDAYSVSNGNRWLQSTYDVPIGLPAK